MATINYKFSPIHSITQTNISKVLKNSFISSNSSYVLIRWRINQIEKNFPIGLQSTFQLRLLASKYLQQRPSFMEINVFQDWKGDYLNIVSTKMNSYIRK